MLTVQVCTIMSKNTPVLPQILNSNGLFQHPSFVKRFAFKLRIGIMRGQKKP